MTVDVFFYFLVVIFGGALRPSLVLEFASETLTRIVVIMHYIEVAIPRRVGTD